MVLRTTSENTAVTGTQLGVPWGKSSSRRWCALKLRSSSARSPASQPPVPVRDDDDGSVADQDDREAQGEPQQQVHRVPDRQHDRQGADERKRYPHHGNHHRAPRAEKREDDDRYDDERLGERPDDLL